MYVVAGRRLSFGAMKLSLTPASAALSNPLLTLICFHGVQCSHWYRALALW